MESSIQVGVNGPAVWVKVEGKGNFLNSGNLKEFARAMLDRGYREFVIDLADCAMMDSTFMGTMASVALRLRELGRGHLHVVPAGSQPRAPPGLALIRFSIFMSMARRRLNARSFGAAPTVSRARTKNRSKLKPCSRRMKRFAKRRRKISSALRTFSII